ncbi:MaoC family dehydratase [Rhizobium sp. SSA_523]|uniref:MaoC family dehydratase n=1 Tax=Rhizobium sp. SSA_523 TaxID=2952477 RepID=UPI002091163B|nr:MaoC family dehydratase [Rhizobium sp. SSA_523]MCO5730418.1 MaoC family dehydratase [Rhizobium sp. SSA_523]WKC25462.1 MaoC family dehydratase [Rhizobium sp. SSA_523]
MKLAELNPIGTRVETGTLLFTADDIIRFATKFDPQPFHLDAEAAKSYVFGGLCASGWHTCAGWMKMFLAHWKEEHLRLVKQGIEPPRLGPSPGFKNLKWIRPVYADDSVTYFVTLTDTRELASRPGTWLNSTFNEGVNQKGETVLRFDSSVLEFT